MRDIGKNIKELRQLKNMTQDELAEIPGIGPERAAAVSSAMAERAGELDELLNAVSLRRSDTLENSPTICFTGKMPEKRSFYEKLAAERGFRAVDSVTAALTLLVAADVNDSSTKLRNARKAGVKIISLDEFLAEKNSGTAVDVGDEFSDLPLFN